YESYQPHLKPIDKPKGDKLRQINKWLSQHRKLVLAVLVALIVIIGGVLIFLFSNLEFSTISDTKLAMKKEAAKIYSPLTGNAVNDEESKRVVTAIMIEN